MRNLYARTGGCKQAGQGMVEYIIIVALVAIGAIAVYEAFGNAVHHQMAAISNGVAGQSDGAIREVVQVVATDGALATVVSDGKLGLDNYAEFAQSVE